MYVGCGRADPIIYDDPGRPGPDRGRAIMRNEERLWDLEPSVILLGALYALSIVAGIFGAAVGLV
jgi:hypothetical protein